MIELYSGEVKIEYNDEQHTYTLDGRKLDGVTSILKMIDKPGLMDWAIDFDLKDAKTNLLTEKNISARRLDEIFQKAGKAHEQLRDTSADFGKVFHKWVEDYVNHTKNDTEMTDDIVFRIESFLEWANENEVRFIDTERVVYSRKHDFCGTLDLTLEMNGKKYVADIKTSNAIRSEYYFQTAAYQQALQEETGVQYDGRCIIRMGSKGLEVKTTDEFESDFAAYEAALVLWRNPRLKDDRIKYFKRKKQWSK